MASNRRLSCAVTFDFDAMIASFRPGAATITAKNPFFQDLGTNGRTCFTCHQPQNGWTVSAQAAHAHADSAGHESAPRH